MMGWHGGYRQFRRWHVPQRVFKPGTTRTFSQGRLYDAARHCGCSASGAWEPLTRARARCVSHVRTLRDNKSRRWPQSYLSVRARRPGGEGRCVEMRLRARDAREMTSTPHGASALLTINAAPPLPSSHRSLLLTLMRPCERC